MSSYEPSIVIGTIVLGALVYNYIKSKYSIDDNYDDNDSGNDLPVFRPVYDSAGGNGDNGRRGASDASQDGSADASSGAGTSSGADGGQGVSADTDASADAGGEKSTGTAGECPDRTPLMADVLRSMGCQPENLDDGVLAVAYQGEAFQIVPNMAYFRIWDASWTSVEANDPDLPKIREAVNRANCSFGPTVVMDNPDENGTIALHSRWDILFHPALGDENGAYMRSVFSAFFNIKEEVRRCYQSLQLKQQTDDKQSRRPIGFPTTQEEETE